MYVPDTLYSNALLYGETPPSIREYIREKAEQVSEYARERGYEFMAKVKDRWDEYNNSDTMRRMRAIRERTQGAYYSKDIVRELVTLSELQQAPPVMRQYIMADPEIKERYRNQRMAGYGDQYHDPYPSITGKGDYYYRRMDQGMVHVHETGYTVRNYYEILQLNDRELDAIEKVAVSRTIDRVKYYLKKGEEDPSSPEGNYL